MTESPFKQLSIDELMPGMYVQEIVEQTGQLKIRSKGRVTKKAIVANLKKKGVKSVIIDTSKQFVPEDEAPVEDTTTDIALPDVNEKRTASFQDELNRAQKLHKKGKKIQKQLLNAVKRGLPFDDKIPKEFSQGLVSSIDRNPDALVCLTKIREKDDYLLEHSLNVAILLAHFARFLGMNDQQVEDLAYSGFLHDLGKIRIPDEILHKPGRLTDEEMQIMKDHVKYGVESLQEVGIDKSLVRTVSEHHERLDGKGYPLGKSADQISYEGRMLSIVDMYDALTADRCYKPGMPSQKAFSILLADSESKLDKPLVQQFIKCMGVYPIGSLVLLSNERVAMVMEQTDNPLAPVVKVFYSVKSKHYLEPKDINLNGDTPLKVVKAVMGSDYRIDVNAFFDRSVVID